MSRPKASGCWNEQHARPQNYLHTSLSSRFWNRTNPLVLRCWDTLWIVVLLTLSLGRTWQPRYLTCGRTPWSAKKQVVLRELFAVSTSFRLLEEFPNSVSLSFNIHQLACATYALKTHASGCPEIFLSRAMLSRTWNRYDSWKSHWHTWFSEVTLSCWPKRDFSNAWDCGRFVQWSQKQPGTRSGGKPCSTMFQPAFCFEEKSISNECNQVESNQVESCLCLPVWGTEHRGWLQPHPKTVRLDRQTPASLLSSNPLR